VDLLTGSLRKTIGGLDARLVAAGLRDVVAECLAMGHYSKLFDELRALLRATPADWKKTERPGPYTRGSVTTTTAAADAGEAAPDAAALQGPGLDVKNTKGERCRIVPPAGFCWGFLRSGKCNNKALGKPCNSRGGTALKHDIPPEWKGKFTTVWGNSV